MLVTPHIDVNLKVSAPLGQAYVDVWRCGICVVVQVVEMKNRECSKRYRFFASKDIDDVDVLA